MVRFINSGVRSYPYILKGLRPVRLCLILINYKLYNSHWCWYSLTFQLKTSEKLKHNKGLMTNFRLVSTVSFQNKNDKIKCKLFILYKNEYSPSIFYTCELVSHTLYLGPLNLPPSTSSPRLLLNYPCHME